MTKTKIFVDSSVIVSASIQANVQEIDISIKHRNYDQSIHLFSIFRKYASVGIGISTKTVRGESFHTLSKAVTNAILENLPPEIEKRKILYNVTNAIINLCDNKMRKLFSSLLIEQPQSDKIQQNVADVTKMSEYIKLRYQGRYINKMNRNIEAKRRTETIINTKWAGMLKAEAYKTQRLQVERESKQVQKFMDKYPNSGDSRILAEAITIKQQIEESDGRVIFYIASCDTGFFSPYRVKGGARSDVVTNEIYSRFGIICDFPNEIRKKINL